MARAGSSSEKNPGSRYSCWCSLTREAHPNIASDKVNLTPPSPSHRPSLWTIICQPLPRLHNNIWTCGFFFFHARWIPSASPSAAFVAQTRACWRSAGVWSVPEEGLCLICRCVQTAAFAAEFLIFVFIAPISFYVVANQCLFSTKWITISRGDGMYFPQFRHGLAFFFF